LSTSETLFEEKRKQVVSTIDSLKPLVEDIAKSLYEKPELGLQEHFACQKLTGILESYGFSIERQVAGLGTAFLAKSGEARPAIAFMAEYDALPGIGHGCGHNLIAASALAAGIANKMVNLPEGTKVSWQVLGTPAEETIGGKVVMVEAGVFQDIDAAFIAHPGQRNSLGGSSWASHPLEVTFYGKSSHAGGNPQEGINALDALVSFYMAVRTMKNHLRDDARLAGIITYGGDAPNIVPARASARFTLRARTSQYLEEVIIPKVKQCAEGIALSIGAKVELKHYEPLFRETLEHPILKDLAKKYFDYLGQEISPETGNGGGVTDVGSVTWVVPCIQIGFAMTETRGHSEEMARSTVTPKAIDATLMAAKVMALSALDLVFHPENLKKAKEYLAEVKAKKT